MSRCTHTHGRTLCFECFSRPLLRVGEFGLQVAGMVLAAEVVRERDALPAQRGEFRAALGDQVVLVDDWRRRFVGHFLLVIPAEAGIHGR